MFPAEVTVMESEENVMVCPTIFPILTVADIVAIDVSTMDGSAGK